MSRLRTVFVIAACVCALAACTQSSPQTLDPTVAREEDAAATLKSQYKDVILGTDISGDTLVVYVDVNNLYSMDEDAEAAMKADALKRWKHIWSESHPHKHAKVHLSMRDYYGKEIYASSANV